MLILRIKIAWCNIMLRFWDGVQTVTKKPMDFNRKF